MTIKIHIINLFLYFSIGYSLGCIQGDCYNGKGMIIYSNGEKYSGEFQKGLKHGYGTYYYGPDLNEKLNYNLKKELRPATSFEKNLYGMYEGEWEEDMRWGFGKYTFPNGQFYLGEYTREKRRGIGMLVFADKTNRYIGEFRRGHKDGWGINHKIMPQVNTENQEILNFLIQGSTMHFIHNDSLNIIESGSFMSGGKQFNENLDSVIVQLVTKYSHRGSILQYLIAYNKELVISLLNKNNIEIQCGTLYDNFNVNCLLDWQNIMLDDPIANSNDTNIIEGDCPSGIYDCTGTCNGLAIIDECGVCNGKGIPIGFCDCSGSILDCAGDCDGTAIIDDCDICCGGTGAVSNTLCSWINNPGIGRVDECGICNGNGPDKNFDCDGNCIVDVDCAGICNGNTVVDECGECGGDGITDGACDCEGNISDCAGECGGDAVIDECGGCNGNGIIICSNNTEVCKIEECQDRGCDLPLNTIRLINNQIIYNSNIPIYGFEIITNGGMLIQTKGGDVTKNNFTTTVAGTTIMSRAFGNNSIKAGCGTLMQIQNDIKNIHITSISIYNNYGIPQKFNIIN